MFDYIDTLTEAPTRAPMNSRACNTLDVCRYVQGLDDLARQEGINIELRTDFGHLCELSRELPDKPYPTAMFDPMKSDVGAHNAFWLKGTDAQGRVVHLQAARLYDLKGRSMAEHFESMEAFYADPSLFHDTEVCRSGAPALRRITGRVAYHGELWIRGENPSFRGRQLSHPLSRLLLGLVLARWAPDFAVAFAYSRSVDRGLPARYGYWHIQPDAVRWQRTPPKGPLRVWLMWLTGEDLQDLTRLPLETEYRCPA